MKEFLSKKFQKAKLHFNDFRSKTIVRAYGLATRLDPRKIRRDKKK